MAARMRPTFPPLPPPVPRPPYQNSPPVTEEDPNAPLYAACSQGNLAQVREHLETKSQLSDASLAYALEEACQNFQLEIVELLLTKTEAKLHFRCFRRCIKYKEYDLANSFGEWPSIAEYQSIFTSGSLKLLPLLKILQKFGSWHPNQVLGPLQRGKETDQPRCMPRQEVALHYPRCVLDLDMLNFLLDSGADASIARYLYPTTLSKDDNLGDDYTVQRDRGDVLEMAVNCGAKKEAIAMLIERGNAKLNDTSLHSLVRRKSFAERVVAADEAYMQVAWKKDMEMKWPDLSTRFETAAYLIELGEDIDGETNVFNLRESRTSMPTLTIPATPLSHAKYLMDWRYVCWLLLNGADPAKKLSPHPPAMYLYSIMNEWREVESTFQQHVLQFEQLKRLRAREAKAKQIKRTHDSDDGEGGSAKKIKTEQEDEARFKEEGDEKKTRVKEEEPVKAPLKGEDE